MGTRILGLTVLILAQFISGCGASKVEGAKDQRPIVEEPPHDPAPPPFIPAIPAIPTGLAITAGEKQVALSWSPVEGATHYSVLRALSNDKDAFVRIIENFEKTAYLDTGLVNDTTYYYCVRAYNVSGGSLRSIVVSATPKEVIVAPPAPVNVTASAGDTMAEIKWSHVLGATFYDVYFSTSSLTPSLTFVASVPPTIDLEVQTYKMTGLTNGTKYYFAILARNTAGASPFSTMVSATPKAAVPDAPTGVNLTSAEGAVVVSWNATERTTSYAVLRGTSPDTLARIQENITGTSFADSTVASGTTYYYAVRAYNDVGGSARSTVVSITTP